MAHALTLDAGLSRQDPASGFIARIRKALADRMLVQRTRAELGGLNDRDLADLGISRADIGWIAREAVYGA